MDIEALKETIRTLVKQNEDLSRAQTGSQSGSISKSVQKQEQSPKVCFMELSDDVIQVLDSPGPSYAVKTKTPRAKEKVDAFPPLPLSNTPTGRSSKPANKVSKSNVNSKRKKLNEKARSVSASTHFEVVGSPGAWPSIRNSIK